MFAKNNFKNSAIYFAFGKSSGIIRDISLYSLIGTDLPKFFLFITAAQRACEVVFNYSNFTHIKHFLVRSVAGSMAACFLVVFLTFVYLWLPWINNHSNWKLSEFDFLLSTMAALSCYIFFYCIYHFELDGRTNIRGQTTFVVNCLIIVFALLFPNNFLILGIIAFALGSISVGLIYRSVDGPEEDALIIVSESKRWISDFARVMLLKFSVNLVKIYLFSVVFIGGGLVAFYLGWRIGDLIRELAEVTFINRKILIRNFGRSFLHNFLIVTSNILVWTVSVCLFFYDFSIVIFERDIILLLFVIICSFTAASNESAIDILINKFCSGTYNYVLNLFALAALLYLLAIILIDRPYDLGEVAFAIYAMSFLFLIVGVIYDNWHADEE